MTMLLNVKSGPRRLAATSIGNTGKERHSMSNHHKENFLLLSSITAKLEEYQQCGG